jgi:hypothetical protein
MVSGIVYHHVQHRLPTMVHSHTTVTFVAYRHFVDLMEAFDLGRLENLPEWESEMNLGSTSEEGVSLLVCPSSSSSPTSFF